MSVETKNPLISVIIPVYNTDKYLRECLDSIINQTLKDIEIICIDDKSTDNSLKILEEYAKKDSRIRILKNEENRGQAISRNIALDEVSGEYISFIDSDDRIDLDAYEKLYEFSKDMKQDMILFNVVRFNEDETWESELHVRSIQAECKKTDILKNTEFVYDTSPCNKLIKASFLKENGFKFLDKLFEDLLFSMELFTSTDSVGVYPDVTYYWRKRKEEDGNLSTTQKRSDIKNLKDRLYIIDAIRDLFASDEKYSSLMRPYNKKLLEMDYRFYMNRVSLEDEEYNKVVLDEIVPAIKEFDNELFDEIPKFDRLKFSLLMSGDIKSIVYIRAKKGNYQRFERQNKKWKKEITELKSTKGWMRYKKDNLKERYL